MSDTLYFAAHTLQEVALIFMALVYTTRLIWMFRFKAAKEKQMKTGLPDTSKRRGVLYSMANIAMPWAMESSRNHFFIYFQFVLFHIGVVFAILQSFLIPYAPEVMANTAILILFRLGIGLAFLVGLFRIVRRMTKKVMRAISTPDDYFSLVLITVWFFFSFMASPNNYMETEFWLLGFFYLTAFFLIYVPFSKISHYLYYPFTRYFFGKTMGHRGGYPLRGTSNK